LSWRRLGMESHGGRLVYRAVEDLDKAAALADGLPRLELRLALGPGGFPLGIPMGRWCLSGLARWRAL